jgi:transcriptional regulator with XRE-family HTH domain
LQITIFHDLENLLSRVTGTTYQAIVGQVIVLRRKDIELSQADLAEKIGTSQSAWSRVEKGLSNLTVEQLTKVATILGVAPNQIIAEADEAKVTLECDGIQVAENKSKTSGWLLLGSAAIGLVILASRVN